MLVPGSVNPLLAFKSAAAGYQISRSLRFNSSDSAYLSRTPASAGNRKTWTWSGWVKRSALSATEAESTLFSGGGGANDSTIVFVNNQLFYYYYASPGGYLADVRSIAVFRDLSAWYHIVVAVDTTQATASNRVRLYVNGSEVSYSSPTYPSLNLDMGINTVSTVHTVGVRNTLANYLSGYLSDIHFIDGQALTPSSFGEFDANGEWQPKAYTGTYGTNGFKLNFADNSAATAAALGKDTSGNGNNWTPNNLSVTAGAGNDSLVDTPTSYGTDTGVGGEVRGNYCTWNPLSLLASATTTNGNLDATTPTTNGGGVFGTIAFPSSGKWYFEVTPATGNSSMVGISDYLSTSSNAWAISPSVFYWNNGRKYVNGVDGGAYGATYTTNDIIGVAVNCDSGSVTFYKNNSSQGAITCTPGGLYPCLTDGTSSTADSFSVNFGQRPFAYTAPSGFKALCDTNLPAPVVAKPSTVMDVKLYTGNGGTQSITGLGFSPDLVWIKARSSAIGHAVTDAVRGASQRLFTETTDAEDSVATLTSFNSDGFGVSTASGLSTRTNGNAVTYAAWCWDAGSSNVVNTQGTITSTVRANPSAGFSVVTYTGTGTNGATVGHGLGVSPGMVIVKSRSGAYEWPVYHSSLSAGNNLFLHLTNAQNSVSGTVTAGGVGGVSSTTFTCTQGVSNINNTNATSATYVAYCFAPVAGYGNGLSYVGNGSTDGPFCYLGFLPKLILIKCSSTTGNWVLLDTEREGYNVDNDPLFPNLSDAEATTDLLDITSNGFKIRSTNADVNASAATYIVYAWASNPFQYSRAR